MCGTPQVKAWELFCGKDSSDPMHQLPTLYLRRPTTLGLAVMEKRSEQRQGKSLLASVRHFFIKAHGGRNWFMKKNSSRKSRGTVPLMSDWGNVCCIFVDCCKKVMVTSSGPASITQWDRMGLYIATGRTQKRCALPQKGPFNKLCTAVTSLQNKIILH
jgi:hypothetical protein